jgi:SNF2 family DNA or RNA helicase
LHLAFGERALLADDMGLGKTIQANAAAELVARRTGIRRVFVVCPASLKAEWEEQIARFSDRTTRLVFGPRHQRLAAYREPAFFTIVNYEQVLTDADDLNALLAPDIIVLDEAQRITNWQTKTARRVKSLKSPYAYVLTGTPLENRIDELYSIIEYLDPELLGSLFRFNRDFYELDERGRPVDYKNLGELRRRVQPLMLRRRKADVEKELPRRTVKTYFVPDAIRARGVPGAHGSGNGPSGAARPAHCFARRGLRCGSCCTTRRAGAARRGPAWCRRADATPCCRRPRPCNARQ